jgi:hypothetical protein
MIEPFIKYSKRNKKQIIILNCECGKYSAFKGGKQTASGIDYRDNLKTNIVIYEKAN